jgi:penicillin-binding protein 2
MLQLPEDRRPPITPQLALRVAILGGIALAMFAIVFFRLWYLQILTGDRQLAQANNNRVRDISIPAPRGDIVDRNGRVMVDNRVSIAAQVDPQHLPPKGPARDDLFRRLGQVIGMSPGAISTQIVDQQKLLPYANVTLKQDVSIAVRNYLLERENEFPGVTVDRVYLRSYPLNEVGAQIFGTVGQISPDDKKFARFRGVQDGTIIGKGGLERAYDRYLRGRNGATRVQIDASGQAKGQLRERLPLQGNQLKLSIDASLEKAGQQAFADIGVPITDGVKNRGAAFVAMDPTNGEILAMGSYPSFDPNVFAKPLKQAVFNKLNSEASGSPLINRAIQSVYPTGSTFKLITSTAALEGGFVTPDTIVDDPGSIRIGNITFHNALNQANGAVNITDALRVSSDVFFYRLGQQMDRQQDNILQRWATKLGMGRSTGIDLPDESTGTLPSPAWRADLFKRKLTDRPWSVGDNVNLAVGQGDLQATPLQLATAYSTVAMGGKVPTPHIGLQVEDAAGRILQSIDPPPSRSVKIAPQTKQTIMEGLRQAASQPGGTSADVFAGFPYEVHGKTGTAEHVGQLDQSWYAAYAPAANRKGPIVVVATVEQGGFGAQAAAPAVRIMLSQWFGVKKKLVIGMSATR